jgi:hypothetical protein
MIGAARLLLVDPVVRVEPRWAGFVPQRPSRKVNLRNELQCDQAALLASAIAHRRPRPSCRERPESNAVLGIAARGRPHCHDRIATARENAGADTRECRADVDFGDGTDALQLGAIDMLHGLGR